MHQRIALGLSTLAGIAIGATAIQGCMLRPNRRLMLSFLF
jgi:hypothetical protein